MSEKLQGTKYITTLPKGSGRVVAMTTFDNTIYVATEKNVYYLTKKNVLEPVFFMMEG